MIKAKYFSQKTKKVCLADDSGLEVDLLKKYPGIFSARWAGKNSDFNLAINKVYKELNKKDNNWKNNKITARFVCALTIYGLKKNQFILWELLKEKYQLKRKEIMVLVMIQFLFRKAKN